MKASLRMQRAFTHDPSQVAPHALAGAPVSSSIVAGVVAGQTHGP
jgi:hypothetical protein